MGNKALKFLIVVIFLGVCGVIIYQQLKPQPAPPPRTTPAARPSGSATAPPQPTPEALHISFYQSKGKDDWVNEVLPEFNQGSYTVGGKPIVVDMYPVRSGDSMQDILDGTIQPTIWNPASKAWIDLINHTWNLRHGTDLISSYQPVVLTALVIGIWEPMANALGYPNAELGWSDFIELTTNPDGWAAYNHPEWGTFKFGHAHPDFSNSALLSVTSLVYAAAGKTAGLTMDDFRRPDVAQQIHDLEQSIVHYGDSSTWLMEKFVNNGPSYLSALTLYENTVVEANLKYPDKAFPVVAIYPKEGTFWVGHPFAIPDAEWVTDEQREAAEIFRDFLLAEAQQKRLMKYGYRPADPNIPLESPIDRAHGANPQMQPTNVLEFPPEDITKRIQELWHQTKKKSTVYLLIDASGSMKGAPMREARKGAELFVKQMEQEDQIQAVSFGTGVFNLGTFGDVKDTGEALIERIRGLYGAGKTPLYDAIRYALKEIDALKTTQQEPRLYGIVVLSDGQDTSSQITKQELLAMLPRNPESEPDVTKIFTIAYGDDADIDTLTEIAVTSNARMYQGSPETIEHVYISISSYF
ncbi:extracellular solute-binding protein [candidate division KSB3 bacterium]|uniref:Extracellular solute-binding protein n=1 Tax=candidate division KSB3 bacterium TaxID=2044937 RepID=A0A9D5JXZ6_9BACT|nr:extracellular solute-binding protein [candidate division KSB3 bacterium]MBD3325897.1 extracellular solute-binding protein [candidate division KSB3 bacterium]